jgi:uncharacterized protein YjbI with pentapeptide repeats
MEVKSKQELQTKLSLSVRHTVELFNAGKDAWNKWVVENPEASISFSKHVFIHRAKKLSFSGFNFPAGMIDFGGAVFPLSGVSFEGVNFNYCEAQSNPRVVSFNGAEFKGVADFNNAKFINMDSAEYAAGLLSFNNTTFLNEVSFRKAEFGYLFVNFNHMVFEGAVDFSEAVFVKTFCSFAFSSFKEHANFSFLNNPTSIKKLTFSHSTFEKSLSLQGSEFSIPVEFVGASFRNQLSLDGVIFSIKRRLGGRPVNHIVNPDSFRRLKDIALDASDHWKSLQFHAEEQRDRRWQGRQEKSTFLLSYLFDSLSGYGQSVIKPLLGLTLTIIVFTCIYAGKVKGAIYGSKLWQVFVYSADNSFPFIPVSKLAREAKIERLFGRSPPPELFDWMVLQGGLSFVFIFLIGLGLRNRFKI